MRSSDTFFVVEAVLPNGLPLKRTYLTAAHPRFFPDTRFGDQVWLDQMPLATPSIRIIIPSPPTYPSAPPPPARESEATSSASSSSEILSTTPHDDEDSDAATPMTITSGTTAGRTPSPSNNNYYSSTSTRRASTVDYDLLTLRLVAVVAITGVLALFGWGDVPFNAMSSVGTRPHQREVVSPVYESASSSHQSSKAVFTLPPRHRARPITSVAAENATVERASLPVAAPFELTVSRSLQAH